jgi:hypothetical protein
VLFAPSGGIPELSILSPELRRQARRSGQEGLGQARRRQQEGLRQARRGKQDRAPPRRPPHRASICKWAPSGIARTRSACASGSRPMSRDKSKCRNRAVPAHPCTRSGSDPSAPRARPARSRPSSPACAWNGGGGASISPSPICLAAWATAPPRRRSKTASAPPGLARGRPGPASGPRDRRLRSLPSLAPEWRLSTCLRAQPLAFGPAQKPCLCGFSSLSWIWRFRPFKRTPARGNERARKAK